MTETMQPPAQKSGFGILPISIDLLEQILCLPDSYKIIGLNFDVYKRTLELTVLSYDLPEVEEGCEFPRLTLMAHVSYLENIPRDYRKIITEIKRV
jgi:hypothetical protein